MISIKEYIAKHFIGRTYRFKCNCIMPFDIVGSVKDYELSGNEIILLVESSGKIIHIGLNTSSLYIEERF